MLAFSSNPSGSKQRPAGWKLVLFAVLVLYSVYFLVFRGTSQSQKMAKLQVLHIHAYMLVVTYFHTYFNVDHASTFTCISISTLAMVNILWWI